MVKSGVCKGFLGKVGLGGVIRGNLGFDVSLRGKLGILKGVWVSLRGKFRVWSQFEGET